MKKISIMLVIALILILPALPALADINQKADLNNGNVIVVKVRQEAWNYGKGDINQNVDVRVSGNLQMADQDSVVFIKDPRFEGELNSTLRGINIISIDLDQIANNFNSGNVSQGIEVEIVGNMNILDQEAMIIV